jgi:hypothetical protein
MDVVKHYGLIIEISLRAWGKVLAYGKGSLPDILGVEVRLMMLDVMQTQLIQSLTCHLFHA